MSISTVSNIEFPHRLNPDSTIRSICPRCSATIGASMWEADLERMEMEHVCKRLGRPVFEERGPMKEYHRTSGH
jgi:hypothetical protein